MAGRAKHEILTTAVEFCAMVCNHGLWYFTGHFAGQWNAAKFSGNSLFSVSRLFHGKVNFYQQGSIQSVSALPGDLTFSQTNNKYDIPSYKRICAKFEVEPTTDFRFMHGHNHGLGYVSVFYDDGTSWPPATLSNPSSQRFADESWARKGKGNVLGSETNRPPIGSKAKGLKQAGLTRLNQ